MPSIHRATVSRKIWLWTNSMDGVKDASQAFDATVVHVHPDGAVDVCARTHTGANLYLEALEVLDPSEDSAKPNHHFALDMAGPYCTWMPYQKKQMDSAPTDNTPVVKPI